MTKVNMQQIIQKTQKVQVNQQQVVKQPITNGPSFEDVLSKIKQGDDQVKFSKHASQRLDERNIKLSEAEIGKISDAMDKASQKGIKDALIIMDNKQFVANVKNKTVITASTKELLKEQIFTKIDGAVII